MPDADKLAIRAHLQARRKPPSPDDIALGFLDSDGELLQPGELLRGWRLTAPKASAWKIWRPGQPPIEAEEIPDELLSIWWVEPKEISSAAF